MRARGIGRRAWLGAALAPCAAGAQVRVASASEAGDLRFDYPLTLLRLLLRVAGLATDLALQPWQSERHTAEALHDGRLDVSILPSVGEKPADLPVLRFPIRRGLLGVRLLLVRQERLGEFARLRSLDTLQRRYVMGYGAQWADNALLRRLGFQLRDVDGYAALFRALANGEVDYLNRGVNEVWGELDHPLLVPHGIALVPGLALSYPLDDYFHLSPQRADWLPRLQAALRTVLQDGRFRQLFFQTYGRTLERAGFAQRRVLQVVGYGVSPGTPLQDFDALRLRPTRVELGGVRR